MGWCTVLAALAAAHNAAGRHAEARTLCERALSTITEEDREYVMLFLQADLQMAHAQAGLGDVDAALSRLDQLLARFAASEHPMALGLLHESRAQIAHRADRSAEREESLDQCEFWFRGTGTPALIAKYERLQALCRASDTLGPQPVPLELTRDGFTPESVSEVDTEIAKD
jgi:ATP/maltotriose-dependent transcriptional regulator MalT